MQSAQASAARLLSLRMGVQKRDIAVGIGNVPLAADRPGRAADIARSQNANPARRAKRLPCLIVRVGRRIVPLYRSMCSANEHERTVARDTSHAPAA